MKAFGILLLLTLSICVSGPATAQDKVPTQEGDWKPLTDDYSRQQLFATDVIDATRDTTDISAKPGSLAIPTVWVFPRDAFYDFIEGSPTNKRRPWDRFKSIQYRIDGL